MDGIGAQLMRKHVRGNTVKPLRTCTVYLDTSAWNSICDTVATPARLRGPEYLFSSCNLDEFGLAPTLRAKELAAFAWRVSNRKKLRDHLELTAAEVTARHRQTKTDYYDQDPGFKPAWRMIKNLGPTKEFRAFVTPHLEASKREFREYLQLQRKIFLPLFERTKESGLPTSWESMLEQFRTGCEVQDMIEGLLSAEGIRLPAGASVAPWATLPGTACWVEYYLSLAFTASFDVSKIGAPERGDQFDFRHACYAGIADVFVTNDARMHEMLTTMVPSCTARVLTSAEFLGQLDRELSL